MGSGLRESHHLSPIIFSYSSFTHAHLLGNHQLQRAFSEPLHWKSRSPAAHWNHLASFKKKITGAWGSPWTGWIWNSRVGRIWYWQASGPWRWFSWVTRQGPWADGVFLASWVVMGWEAAPISDEPLTWGQFSCPGRAWMSKGHSSPGFLGPFTSLVLNVTSN